MSASETVPTRGIVPLGIALCLLFAPTAHGQAHDVTPEADATGDVAMGEMMAGMHMHMMSDPVIHHRMMSDPTMYAMMTALMTERMSRLSPHERRRMMSGMPEMHPAAPAHDGHPAGSTPATP